MLSLALSLALTLGGSPTGLPAALAAAPGPSSTSIAPKALTALQQTLRHHLALARGTDGALVVDTDTGQTLFSADPTVGRIPASVEKLYTTTTALFTFGPDATLSTAVLGAGTLGPGGVWKGTLYLRGGGDPTFGSANFDERSYGPGVGATVQELASSMRAAGIRSVQGAIVGDESFLDSLRGTPATGFAPNIEVEGELSALAFDDGFTSASEFALQPRPALFAAQSFAAALRAAEIRVPKRTPIFTGPTPPNARPLATVPSPPIATLIRLTNAPSDNFFAEMLLKDLGARFGRGGSTAAGAAVVRSVIAAKFGLQPILDDGSGLSDFDRSSPAEVVSLLEQMQTNPAFVQSLAVAGVSGTMEQEMLGTRAVNNCRGKTGTLSDVANLVGYCTARNGDTLAFAFMLGDQANPAYGHLMEDQMGVALANYDGAPLNQGAG